MRSQGLGMGSGVTGAGRGWVHDWGTRLRHKGSRCRSGGGAAGMTGGGVDSAVR